MKPPIPYYGAKIRMAPRIVELLPEHAHYVEPFAGSLAVLLAKPRSKVETVNDLDGDLVLFWRVLRDRPDELERVCALTPHSREEFALSMGHGPDVEDELERARRVWVHLTQGFAGILGGTGWRRSTGSARRLSNGLLSFAGRLVPSAERIQGVTLECRDALELIRDYGKYETTCIYADPPYLGTTRAAGYVVEMTEAQPHQELAAALNDCRASVVLSGYHSQLYEDLYAVWDRHEIADSTVQGGAYAARTEVLWVKQSGYGTAREPDRQLTDAMF